MGKTESIYLSLDEAREELKKRWNDTELKKRVEDELGDNFLSAFKNKPRSAIIRCLLSPDNGLVFFLQRSCYVNAVPIGFEYSGDKFVTINEEKKGLGRLRLVDNEGGKMLADIVDFKSNENKKINEVITISGELMVDFHHNLLDHSKYNIEIHDATSWLKQFSDPSQYYESFLAHFIAHGVLFEFFLFDEEDTEDYFTKNVVLPAIEKVKNKYGVAPLIVRLYPKNQNEEEDFYWWSYPPSVNEYLISYSKANNIPLKLIKQK